MKMVVGSLERGRGRRLTYAAPVKEDFWPSFALEREYMNEDCTSSGFLTTCYSDDDNNNNNNIDNVCESELSSSPPSPISFLFIYFCVVFYGAPANDIDVR